MNYRRISGLLNQKALYSKNVFLLGNLSLNILLISKERCWDGLMNENRETFQSNLAYFYLILCIFGTLLPYSQFILFLLENGLDITLFIQQLLVNYIILFFVLDVLVSAVVLILFVIAEGKRMEISHLWLPILTTFAVGVSLGLPLFLYMRQIKIGKTY